MVLMWFNLEFGNICLETQRMQSDHYGRNDKHTNGGQSWVYYCQTPDLPILPSPAIALIGKSGRLYIRVVVCSAVCHAGNSSDVTLAFKDAQVIPPFSMGD